MRKTGIDLIGDCSWGTHFCQFYRTAQDLSDVLIPYFKTGLESNESCMWITSPPLGKEEAESALRKAVPDLESRLQDGQIEILPHSDWYLKGGTFDQQRVLDGWLERLERALARGFDGLRLTGNTFWLEKKDWRAFADYEATVNAVIGNHRMIALCSYSLEKCGGLEILDVVRNHQFALIKSEKGWDLLESSEVRQARELQRESEERYRVLFNAMNEGFALHEILRDEKGRPVDYRFLEVNPAFERLTGLARAELAGRTVRQVLADIDPSWIETFGKVATTGEPAHLEMRSAQPKRIYEVKAFRPRPGQFATTFVDVTERRQAEDALRRSLARLDLLGETASQLLRTDSPQQVIDSLCRKVMAFLDCAVFFNFLVDEERNCLHLNACAGIPEEEARRIEWLEYGAAVCGCAARDGCRIVCDNIPETPDPRTDLVKSYGIKAYACHPLISQGKVLGTLSFGASSRSVFTDDDLSLMKAVADQVSIAIERQRSKEALERANEDLEKRVAERAGQLREQTRFLEASFQHSFDCLVFLDKQFNFIRVNDAYARACRRDRSDFPGHNHFELYPNAENQAIFEEVVRSKTPHQALAKPFSFPDHPDWGVSYWDWTLDPVLDAKGEVDFLVFSLRDVTRRQAGLERLREASRYARSLLEASLDPLVTISQDGKITDVNEATELVTGVAREQLIGSNFSDYFTEPDKANTGYQKVISEGLVRDYPLTIRHSSGRTTDVLYNATVYRDAAGNLQGVFAAARDITEHKRMERVQQESEARYRSLVTATAQIVWTASTHGEVVEDIPSWREYTGQTLEQIKGWGWSDAIHPEDRERTRAIWTDSIRNCSLYEVEYRVRRHDGEYRHFAVRGVPVFEPDGHVREWVGACTDITERKEAERRRSATNALLELFAQKSSSQEYLDSVVDVIRQWSGCQALGIRITDDKGEIPYASWRGFAPDFIATEQCLSINHDQCCCIRAVTQAIEPQDAPVLTRGGSFRFDNSIEFMDHLSPAERSRFRGTCMKHGFASVAVIPIRYHDRILGAIHLADRRPRHLPQPAVEFIESMTPLIGEAIQRFRAEAELGRYRDHLEVLVRQRTGELESVNTQLQMEIGERLRAEESLRRTAEELKRSNRDLEQFAYVSSHDLQEPLRAVAGYVELLQHRYGDKLDDKAHRFISGAADGATRMQRLIIDLLAFSRVGTQGMSFEPVDLKTALDTALTSLKVSAQEAGAQVTCDPLPVLRADATQIAQLLQNLIGNAIKFRSEAPPRIHVGAEKRPGHWLISVRDNGIGVDPQYAERIFLIFQRLHTRETYPGTGIGLAICKRIVERHGGQIWLEPNSNQGSKFCFTIPFKEEDLL